ncbi:MAG TPA: response regulator, partial [Clostridia bacterium]|nr:response regulator [Clostridia bacterium]
VCSSLKKLLHSQDFEVFAAWDAAGAIHQFKSNDIDLVVLDINLGNDDGWSVFQAITDINPFVPIIVITAEWGQHHQAVALGAEALVEKPIDVPSFLELINSLLDESADGRLRRVREDQDYCRYQAKDYATMLRALQERRTAPLELSSGIKSALPGSEASSVPRKQTVIGTVTSKV